MAIKSALGRQLGTQFDSVFDVVKSNLLYDKSGGKIPSLDLNFAKIKSLRDSRSTKNKITFSRASSGTYVDSDGLIKTSPVNLIRYSEQFDNSLWTKSGNFITVTSDQAIAPDGTLTADLATNGTSPTASMFQVMPVVENTTYTFSFWAKNNGGTRAEYRILAPGVADIVPVNTSYFNQLSDTEFRRITLTFTTPPTTTSIYAYTLSGTSLTTNANNIYLWGAQLEEGTTATDYIPTGATVGGAPRFDHDPVTGESLGLLIEEGRTNKMLRSENLQSSSTYWKYQDGGDTSLSNITSPDGVSKMWLVDLSSQSGTSTSGSRIYQGNLAFDNVVNTFSFYARSVSGTGTFPVAYYDGSNYIKSYVTLTEETQRYNISCPAGMSTSGTNIFGFPRRGTTHDETLTQAYVWGCQVEAGSFPTSYIPTELSAVTRSPDIATIEGNKFAKTNLLEYSERFDQSVWSKVKKNTALVPIVTPNSALAPDGTQTADRVVCEKTGSDYSMITKSGISFTGPSTTGSIYLKSNTGSNQAVYFRVGVSDHTEIVVTPEWQRFSSTVTHTGSGNFSFGARYTSNDNVDILAWGAQLEEGSELTDYTPSVETFDSRASSATYVDDATGLIKTTPVNKLLRSNEFTSGSWVKNSVTSVSTNTTAPDGTATATTYTFTQGYGFIYQDTGSVIGQSYVNSIWIKGNANATVGLRIPGMNNTTVGSNGSVAINVTTEWQKFTAVTTSAENTDGRLLVDARSGNSASVPSGFELSLWHAQTEEGTTPTEYIPTTSTISGAARYENGDLLLEPARTNLIRYSSDLSQSYWSKTKISVTTVQESNPFNYTDVFSVRGTGVGIHELRPNVNNFYANTTSTFSAFATADGTGVDAGLIQLRIYNLGHTSAIVNFDLNAGTANAADGLSGTTVHGHTWTISDYGLDPYGNGWYRVWMTAQVSSIGNAGFVSINNINAGDVGGVYNYTASGNGGCLITGIQLEDGSFKTSIIPTSGSAVTRAADVSTSAPGVDSWYNQSEGTVFGDVKNYPHPVTGKALPVLAFSDNTFNNRVLIAGSTGTDQFALNVTFNGSQQKGTIGNFTSSGLKASGGYKSTGSAGSLDGSVAVTVNTPNIPSVISQLNIGQPHTGSQFINGHISRLAYFPTRLPDDKLKSITT